MNESPLAIVYVLCKDKILNFLSILNVQFQKKNLELKIWHFTIHVCFVLIRYLLKLSISKVFPDCLRFSSKKKFDGKRFWRFWGGVWLFLWINKVSFNSCSALVQLCSLLCCFCLKSKNPQFDKLLWRRLNF